MATKTTSRGGEALRELRRELGLTQDEMSARTGVNQGYISQIERGDRRLTASTAFRVCAKLDVDLPRLFDHVDPDPDGDPAGAQPAAVASLGSATEGPYLQLAAA